MGQKCSSHSKWKIWREVKKTLFENGIVKCQSFTDAFIPWEFWIPLHNIYLVWQVKGFVSSAKVSSQLKFMSIVYLPQRSPWSFTAVFTIQSRVVTLRQVFMSDHNLRSYNKISLGVCAIYVPEIPPFCLWMWGRLTSKASAHVFNCHNCHAQPRVSLYTHLIKS